MRIRIPPAPPESGAHSGAFSDSGGAGWDPSAASIGAAPHSGDRLFRLTSEPMKFPPPAVIGSSPRSAFHIKSAPAGSDLKLHAPHRKTLGKSTFLGLLLCILPYKYPFIYPLQV